MSSIWIIELLEVKSRIISIKTQTNPRAFSLSTLSRSFIINCYTTPFNDISRNVFVTLLRMKDCKEKRARGGEEENQ
jgi:hypothetical protein